MQTRYSRVIFSFLLSLGVLSPSVLCQPQLARPQDPSPTDHVVIGRELVTDLAEKHFDLVEQHFNETVARMLPPDILRATWTKMTSDLGDFVTIKWAGHEQKQDLDYVYVTCHFSRKDIDLVFVFDALQKVAGFKTLPASSFGLWHAPSYANPSSFSELEVKIGQQPWILPGTLAIPKGPGPFPAVVLVHGWGANDEDETEGPNRTFKDIAWGLASRGIAVLRYVKRTKQYGAEVSKSLSSFTVEQETIDDANSAVAFLAGMHRIDPHHVFLLGEGLGGYLAPRTAASDPHIAGLILIGAYARPLEDVVADQIRARIGHTASPTVAQLSELAEVEQEKRQVEDPSLKPGGMIHLGGTLIPSTYLLDLRGYNPPNVAAKLKIPLLILQGENGLTSPSADWGLWRTSLQGRANVTFKSYPGLGETLLPVQKSDVTEAKHVPTGAIAEIIAWVQHKNGTAIHAAK